MEKKIYWKYWEVWKFWGIKMTWAMSSGIFPRVFDKVWIFFESSAELSSDQLKLFYLNSICVVSIKPMQILITHLNAFYIVRLNSQLHLWKTPQGSVILHFGGLNMIFLLYFYICPSSSSLDTYRLIRSDKPFCINLLAIMY